MMLLRILIVLLAGVVLDACSASADDSAAIAAENLIEHEVDWPYRVSLTSALTSQSAVLKPGLVGVLIRVERGERARVDFGRDGVHSVPIGATNLVDAANSLRLGSTTKLGPNLAVAIGPRLADSASAAPRLYGFDEAARKRGFLCVAVAADPESIAALAAALAPLHDRFDVATVLLPQGDVPDLRMREVLRNAGWEVPFVLDHLAEAYARSLFSERTAFPAVLLQSAEGRVILEAPWSDGAEARVEAALDAEFGERAVRVESASSL